MNEAKREDTAVEEGAATEGGAAGGTEAAGTPEHPVEAEYQRGQSVKEKAFTCRDGTNLLGCALANKTRLDHICRVGICGTCQVVIDEGWDHLSPPTEEELSLLTEAVIAEGVRLSCQAEVKGPVTIRQ